MECLALGLLTVVVYIPQTTFTRLMMGLSAVRIAVVTSSMLPPCHLTQPHNERATEPTNSHLQVEQSNGAPDDYYICNWTAPEWRALTPQSILRNSPPSLFRTCCVDHLSNCQLADLWWVLIVPTYKVIVAVVHNNVLYWVAMWNKLVPWQQHGGMGQILLLINNWGNSDQAFELHLIEVCIIPNSGRSPNLLGPCLGYGEWCFGTKVQHGMIPGNAIFVKILGFDEKEWMS